MSVFVQIDRFGRVLIPKALRESLCLQPGEQLEAELEDGVIYLRPAARPVSLVEHQGRLVLTSSQAISGDPVSDERKEQITKVPS